MTRSYDLTLLVLTVGCTRYWQPDLPQPAKATEHVNVNGHVRVFDHGQVPQRQAVTVSRDSVTDSAFLANTKSGWSAPESLYDESRMRRGSSLRIRALGCRAGTPVITGDSIGPLRAAMTLAELRTACPARLLHVWMLELGHYQPVVGLKLGDLYALGMPEDTFPRSRIRFGLVTDSVAHTQRGVGVGSTLTRFEKAYGHATLRDGPECTTEAVFAGLPGVSVSLDLKGACGVTDSTTAPPDTRISALYLDPRDSLITTFALTRVDLSVLNSCDGTNVSPLLAWNGAPTEAKSFTVFMDDPYEGNHRRTHWVLFNIPAHNSAIPEGVERTERPPVPAGATQGVNVNGHIGYDGPCPPAGPPLPYAFEVYALDTLLALKPGATRADVDQAMQDHVLAVARTMRTYARRTH